MSEIDRKFPIVRLSLFALVMGLGVLVVVVLGADPIEIIRWSSIPMVLFWFGWVISLFIVDGSSRMTRVVATLGLLLLIEHVLIAMSLAHGWSHKAAFEHTERVSGFGFGIWVNYAFILLWTIDVAWQWLHIRSYRRRPRWLAIGVQAFYAFIMFNATVIYGTIHTRWVGVGMFLILGSVLYERCRNISSYQTTLCTGLLLLGAMGIS